MQKKLLLVMAVLGLGVFAAQAEEIAPAKASTAEIVPSKGTDVGGWQFEITPYGGYNCYYVDGVYYRPVFYGGQTVYVVVP